MRTLKQYSVYNGACSTATPLVFCAVLVKCRQRLECSDWTTFCIAVKRLAKNWVLPVGTIQHHSPNYKLATGPDLDLLMGFEKAGIFHFDNGEPITATALWECFYGRRDADGNPVT